MVFTRKKRQSSKRLLSQLDDFDQDMIIGNAASERQEIVEVNKGTNDQDFTISTSSNNTAVNASTVSVKTLKRCFNERIEREMSHIIDTVENTKQNAILTVIDKIVAPKIELVIKSVNASSGRDVTSVVANSERGEHVGINASFGNASGNNSTLGVSNSNDETRHNIPDEVSELSVPETHFDRQAHTHHRHSRNFGFLVQFGRTKHYQSTQDVSAKPALRTSGRLVYRLTTNSCHKGVNKTIPNNPKLMFLHVSCFFAVRNILIVN